MPVLLTPQNTSPAEAVKAIRLCVEMGALTITQHAREAADDDGLLEADIEAILAAGDVTANRAYADRWCVKCPGSALVVVELEADPWTVVVTVFHP